MTRLSLKRSHPHSTRSLARGIELLARRDVGGRFAWSASYALARADDEIDAAWVPRPRDQRHTVRLELAYRPTPSWSLSWAWQYHSGWPSSRQDFEVMTAVDGSHLQSDIWADQPRTAASLPPTRRQDLQALRRRQRPTRGVFRCVQRVQPAERRGVNHVLSMTPQGSAVVPIVNPLLRAFPTFGARREL
jgi:hypothetical protein